MVWPMETSSELPVWQPPRHSCVLHPALQMIGSSTQSSKFSQAFWVGRGATEQTSRGLGVRWREEPIWPPLYSPCLIPASCVAMPTLRGAQSVFTNLTRPLLWRKSFLGRRCGWQRISPSLDVWAEVKKQRRARRIQCVFTQFQGTCRRACSAFWEGLAMKQSCKVIKRSGWNLWHVSVTHPKEDYPLRGVLHFGSLECWQALRKCDVF